METWRSETASGIRGAAPAPCGLADVVRGVGRLSGKSVVHELLLSLDAGLAGGHSAVGKKSFSARSSAIYPRGGLRIQIHRSKEARARGNLVEPGIQRAVLSDALPQQSSAFMIFLE